MVALFWKNTKSKNSFIPLSDQNLVISPAPKTKSLKYTRPFYFPFKQSMSPRLGAMITSDSTKISNIFGFSYMLPQSKSPHLELGVDLTSKSFGILHIGKKWIIKERTNFRRYYRLNLSHKLEPSKQLATLITFENYYVSAGIGFEKLLFSPASLRVELEVALGMNSSWSILTAGYSWAW